MGANRTLSVGSPRTVIDVLKLKYDQAPDAPAYFVEEQAGWRPYTRREYCAAVVSLAIAMRRRGVRRGDRVALISSTRYEWEVADKAILSLGAVVVAIDVKSPKEDVTHILGNARVSSAIVENETVLGILPAHFKKQATLLIAIDDVEALRDAPNTMGWLDSPDFREGSIYWPEPIDPDDQAVILYTSGTTGKPKGIPLRHRNLARGCSIMGSVFESVLEGTHVSISWLPLSNGTGRFINLVGFYLGAHQYFVRDPAQIMAKIKAINPTYMFGVPRFYEKVHDGIMERLSTQRAWLQRLVRSVLWLRSKTKSAFARNALDMLFIGRIRQAVFGSRMQFMFCGSAPTDPAVLRFYAALGVPVLECYGLSESAILLAMNRPDRMRIGTVGPLLEGNDIRFADDNELLLKGDGLFEGYVDADNAEVFDAQGYYRTGDLGVMDGDYLILTGRKKEIIKTSTGLRISPMEIEQAYGRIEGVDHIVAVGEGRRFVAGLITLDRAATLAWCAKHGIEIAADGDITQVPQVHQHVELELSKRHHHLAANKQLRTFALLASAFTLDGGELTPSLKLKRSVIESKYKKEIDRLYEEAR